VRTVSFLVVVVVFIVGLLAGTALQTLNAQTPPDPCVAAWDVVVGTQRPTGEAGTRPGWHAVKWNRCSGEAVVFAADSHKLDENNAWRKLAVK
jgi:hypothetical protein